MGVACAACLERLAGRFRQPRCVQNRTSSLTGPTKTLKHIKPSQGVSNAFERALRCKRFHLKAHKTLLRVPYLTSACFNNSRQVHTVSIKKTVILLIVNPILCQNTAKTELSESYDQEICRFIDRNPGRDVKVRPRGVHEESREGCREGYGEV